MCLAIVKPAGKTIAESHLAIGFENNSDGAGFAWAEDGKVHVFKSLSYEKFIEEYALREQFPMLVHFRWATHGEVGLANCHPWQFCDGKLAAIHNGILPIQSTQELSDTGHFVKLVLEPIAKKMNLGNPAVRYLIEETIGKTNKICVMDGTGKTHIFNEGEGHWNDGVWFSNTGYKVSRGVTSYGAWDWDRGTEREWVSAYDRKYDAAQQSKAGKDAVTQEMTDKEADAAAEFAYERQCLIEHYRRQGLNRQDAEEMANEELEQYAG